MRLSRSTAVVLGLLAAVDCGAAYLLIRPRPITGPQGATEIYPHVNASCTYRVDPAWPIASARVEPGEITGVAVDCNSRVWVLGLGRPPVRLYDAQGNFLRGWGTGELVLGHQLRLDRDETGAVVEAPRAPIGALGDDPERVHARRDRVALGVREQPVPDSALFVARRDEELVDHDRCRGRIASQRDVARRFRMLAGDEDEIAAEDV